MHKLVTILVSITVVFLLALAASAEVPNLISYQGRLTESDGTPVADGSYNITFEIHEHDPVPMGEPLLWSSGVQAVSVTDGLFVYYLGSNVPLPASVFTDDGLESHYLRFRLDSSPIASAGVQLASVPFALHAAVADTAAYALSAPGGSGGGWVDDGSVVRLLSSSDKVGIGESNPSYSLVVGKNLGSSFDDEFIVCGNGYYQGYSGYKLGFNTDNYAEMKWYGTGEELVFNTRSLGTNYLNALVLGQGKIGINNFSPSEPLSIGSDLGSAYGDLVQIGNNVAGRYSGFMFGEDADNRGAMLWINNSNEFRLGYKTGGTDYGAHLTLKDGEMHLTGTGDASVQLPTDAISSAEILDEPGIGRAVRANAIAADWDWTTIHSRTCTFPTSGYAVVLVTADLQVQFQNIHVEFGITNNSTIAPHLYTRQHDFENSPNFTVRENFNIHEVFSVSAGSNIFSFVGKSLGDEYRGYIYATSMTIMFFPTAYGTVSAVAASPDDTKDFSNVTAQPRLYTSEAVPASAGGQSVEERIQTETDAIRTEFEQQLQAMREEFQQQLNSLTAGRQ